MPGELVNEPSTEPPAGGSGTIDNTTPEGEGGRLDNETVSGSGVCPIPPVDWKNLAPFNPTNITPPTVSGSSGSPGTGGANAVKNIYCADGALYAQVGNLSIQGRSLIWSDLQTYLLDCAASQCDACAEELCAQLSSGGGTTALLYSTRDGVLHAVPDCPEEPPVPPPVTPPYEGCPADTICVRVYGATAKTIGPGATYGTFDTTSNPSNSRGTYKRYAPSADCVYGNAALAGNGAEYEESNYLAVYAGQAYSPGPGPAPEDAGMRMPFGYDTGMVVGAGIGADQAPWVGVFVQIKYDPTARQWGIGIGRMLSAGLTDPLLSTPHGVDEPALPAVFPLQTTLDDINGGTDVYEYGITSAIIDVGSCSGLVANPAFGLFPGSVPTANMTLATTTPTADTATVTYSPGLGGWLGFTAGGSLPVFFQASANPTLEIDGQLIPTIQGGVMNGLYQFNGAMVYQ